MILFDVHIFKGPFKSNSLFSSVLNITIVFIHLKLCLRQDRLYIIFLWSDRLTLENTTLIRGGGVVVQQEVYIIWYFRLWTNSTPTVTRMDWLQINSGKMVLLLQLIVGLTLMRSSEKYLLWLLSLRFWNLYVWAS